MTDNKVHIIQNEEYLSSILTTNVENRKGIGWWHIHEISEKKIRQSGGTLGVMARKICGFQVSERLRNRNKN